MEARWYQTEAKEETFKFISNHPNKHPLIVCPTGAGKSFILSSITKQLILEDNRVLVVSHVEEIIEQDAEALGFVLPRELIGIYSAGIGRKERKRVTVASINSIYKKPELFSNYNFIIVDEAHTIPVKDEGMYRTLFNNLNATIIGLTATPFRTGSGYLVGQKDSLFDEIVFDVPVERLIAEGYLSKLLTNATNNQLDVEGIATVAGDYSKKGLSEKLDKNEVTEKVVSELVTYKEKYKCWLLFAIDIKHCVHLTELLNAAGINARCIHSKQPKHERKQNIKDFKAGKFQAFVSVATLTTGFDHPEIDLVALVRPTKSPCLHIQMIGRGLRIHINKQHCLILDFAGNILRLGPINDVHVRVKGDKKGSGAPPVKVCFKCNTHVPAGAKTCYSCGYIFPESATQLNDIASSLAVVLPQTDSIELNGWYPVSQVKYSSFLSRRKTLSMRVSYTLGNNKIVHEYINPFTNTKASFNNIHWWKFRTAEPLPVNIKGMIAKSNCLKLPRMMKLNFDNQYPQIIDSSF